MKRLSLITCLYLPFVLVSCSDDEAPDYPVFMQPSSIIAVDGAGPAQTFEYDDYGRIVAWDYTFDSNSVENRYTARYAYPDDNTIKITAEDCLSGGVKRCYEETVTLENGRAVKSEGTFIYSQPLDSDFEKTYRLEFTYDPANHLTAVRHSEVMGVGDDVKSDAWDNPWTWENYLIWEDGNLMEYQDYQGNSTVSETVRFEYYPEPVENPVIFPVVVNSAHHTPLMMQGVFGRNSVNLLKYGKVCGRGGSLNKADEYSYDIQQGRIMEYVATHRDYTLSTTTRTTYKVTWTEK